MLILRRPGVIHLDCFTDRPDVYQFAKIDHSRKFIPEWWKELTNIDPTRLHPYPTMKTCQGFLDLFASGVMMPLWSDLSILLGEQGTREYNWQFADSASEIGTHETSQRGNYLPDIKYQHLKITSPWIFRTKQDLQWVVHSPTWCSHNPSAIIFPQGILNFKWQTGTNINFFLERKTEKQKFLLEFGYPLLQFIPMSQKKIIIHHHLVSPNEIITKFNLLKLSKFRNGYNVGKKILQEKESKCPFGFK